MNKQLLFQGWTVIRFWGNDIQKCPHECVKVVEEAIFDITLKNYVDIEDEIE